MPVTKKEVEAAALVFKNGDHIKPRVVAEHGQPGADAPTDLIVSIADFLAGFVPPDYLLDGVLQRRFVYSLTAQAGHGKTALALLIARLVGGSRPNAALGKHAAEKGRVVFFAGRTLTTFVCGSSAMRICATTTKPRYRSYPAPLA